MPEKPLHILVSPLDWGLGHATRCVPVIRQLLGAGHKVSIAGHGRSIKLLQNEFPAVECIDLPGFSPVFSGSGPVFIKLLLLLPEFIIKIFTEHKQLKQIIRANDIDCIISDNRYGLWHKQVKSILITHQVMIKTPGWLKFAEYPLYRISGYLISRFDECWIPDTEESPGLSGDLSHKYPLPRNARFVGPLTRFVFNDNPLGYESPSKQIAVIISGPEPQRSIFEKLVRQQLSGLQQPVTIISGKPEAKQVKVTSGNITIVPHLPTDQLQEAITSASLVICRSGYSSIMDLNALGAKALFVPTPGQTEQIYLAQLHQQNGTAWFRSQEEMNLKIDIEEAMTYPGFKPYRSESVLAAAIAGLQKK